MTAAAAAAAAAGQTQYESLDTCNWIRIHEMKEECNESLLNKGERERERERERDLSSK
jgi:hypothetical protein